VNENDVIRDAILRHLYAVHQKAKSPRSAGIKISDLNKAMRPLGYKQQQVAHNLDYLIQKGWAREDVETRMFTTPRGTTQPSEKRTYKVSDVGIDHLEAASVYERSPQAPGINITNIAGVTVVGEGNVVNTQFTEASEALDQLRGAALASDELDEHVRLDVVADIDALRSQLQKPDPDADVVKRLWTSIERAAAVGSLAQTVANAAHLLGPLLG
jgi:hypothetical protein